MFHEYGRKRYAGYERLFTISSLEILEERCSRGELPRRELELTGCFLQTLRSLPPRRRPAFSAVLGVFP
jgi:hypothetical protein